MAIEKKTRLSEFITKRIQELQDVKSQLDIAVATGFPNANMISHIKRGIAKLAIDRVPAMAKALDVDPNFLFRLAAEQFYTPEIVAMILDHSNFALSKNEQSIIEFVRTQSGDRDPGLNDRPKNAITDALKDN